MNIYNFIKKQHKNNHIFLSEIQNEHENLIFSPLFRNYTLSDIEFYVKKDLIPIIEFESEIAIKSGLSDTTDDFIDNLSNRDEWIAYFFEEYNFINNYFNKMYNKIRYLIQYVLNCLSVDVERLGMADKTILKIEIGEGDFHNGLSTCKLLFTDGTQIYFKPRSLAIDNAILGYSHKIEKKLGRRMFYPVENIDCGDYGWSIPVIKRECQNQSEVKNFYFNMGFLAAFSYFLNIQDLIYDNIIACGDRIALIDLECFASLPREINKRSQFVMNSYAGDIYLNSVLDSGIIPRHTYGGRYNDGESDASLSYIPKRKASYNYLD